MDEKSSEPSEIVSQESITEISSEIPVLEIAPVAPDTTMDEIMTVAPASVVIDIAPEVTMAEVKIEPDFEIVNDPYPTSSSPKQNVTSLSLLSQYESSSSDSAASSDSEPDSDTDSDSEVTEVKPPPPVVYRDVIKIEDSSDSESSSESDSEEEKPNVEMCSDTESTCPETSTKETTQPKVRGEMDVTELPHIEDLTISVPEYECIPLGKITSIIEQMVLVDSLPGHVPLNIDTVLFLDKGKRTLGKIFDVIGQVSNPLYCVLFNTQKEIAKRGLLVGTVVYCAPRTEHTSFIILSDLMRNKGSDASWKDDIEPPDKFLDYSDDEQERCARKARKGYVNSDPNAPTDATAKRQRQNAPQARHHQRRNTRQPHHNMAQPNFSWHHNLPQGQQMQAPSYINPYAVQQHEPTVQYFNPFAVPPPPPPPQ